MGKPIEREFGQNKTIFKHFGYKGEACLVPQSMAGDADENGKKIVKAGTPFPANDETCLGYLDADVDVTMGDAPGTYAFQAEIDNAKLAANGIVVSSDAKAATPRVTFMD